jgi:hypothetical protein
MAASDQIVFFQRKDHIREASQHIVNVTFRDRATAANVTPTNIRYRIDDLTTGVVVLDWTAVSADDEIAITITPTQNALQCQGRDSLRELTVAADYALATQFVDSVRFTLENLQGVT